MKASNYDMQIKCILMHANLLQFNFHVCHWLKQILVISICNTIPFCPFLPSTTLRKLQTEITIMGKIHQIVMITWFSRNKTFHWFFCLHCKNHCVQEFRGAENVRTYNENFVYFSHLVHLCPQNKIKLSLLPLLPHFYFSAQHLTFFSHCYNSHDTNNLHFFRREMLFITLYLKSLKYF